MRHTPKERRRGASLPSQTRESVGGNATLVCDAWPVRRQTDGYLPRLRRYQFNTWWWQKGIWLCEQLAQVALESAAAGIRTRDRQSSTLTTRPPNHISAGPLNTRDVGKVRDFRPKLSFMSETVYETGP